MMSLGSRKESGGNDISVGSIRTSQLITTFGSGSIADMPDYSVIMCGIEKWNERNSKELREKNLERMLHVSKFRKPAVKEDKSFDKAFDKTFDIPAYRFPYMHFCPECGSLKSFRSFGTYDVKKCGKCDKKLVPSRFVAACVNGHLEDFPYDWWVHHGKQCENLKEGEDSDLEIRFSDKSSGLESIIIRCRKCGKERSMEGCMNKDALRGYVCRGFRPWLGKNPRLGMDFKRCEAVMRGLQRGASNIYFAQTQSALTIPEWAGRVAQDVQPYYGKYREFVEMDVDPEKALQKVFKPLLDQGYSLDEIRKEVKRLDDGGAEEEYTPQMLNEDEYKSLSGPDLDVNTENVKFHTQHIGVPDFLKDYVSDVVLVKKVREVLALKGFRRIYPGSAQSEDDGDDKFQGWNQPGDYVPLTDRPLGWLPAVEMKGEGIFILINHDRLNEWAAAHDKDYETMRNNLKRSKMLECDNFSPQYVMLHTLSHLLIRQLSIECGYSGAAIKERIYSTWPDSHVKMAGILLYTSSSDSDGSLGGLVRKGLPESMENLFRNLLQEASWCSSDPVCINSPAQGMDSLNYAACHACTLLPETCCEKRNCLLDRAAIVGKLDDRSRGFFSALMNQ